MEIIVKFKTLYGYGGCCLKIIDVCMDFEPCFKVHNFVCGHPSSVTQGQLVEAKQSKPGRNRRGESDSEVTVRRLGKIMQRIFLLIQEPAFAESLGNGLERLVSQGLSYFYRKLANR